MQWAFGEAQGLSWVTAFDFNKSVQRGNIRRVVSGFTTVPVDHTTLFFVPRNLLVVSTMQNRNRGQSSLGAWLFSLCGPCCRAQGKKMKLPDEDEPRYYFDSLSGVWRDRKGDQNSSGEPDLPPPPTSFPPITSFVQQQQPPSEDIPLRQFPYPSSSPYAGGGGNRPARRRYVDAWQAQTQTSTQIVQPPSASVTESGVSQYYSFTPLDPYSRTSNVPTSFDTLSSYATSRKDTTTQTPHIFSPTTVGKPFSDNKQD